jgi:hypothetical protein
VAFKEPVLEPNQEPFRKLFENPIQEATVFRSPVRSLIRSL